MSEIKATVDQGTIKRAEAVKANGYDQSMPSRDMITLKKGDVFIIIEGVYNIPIGRKRLGQTDTRQRYQANYADLYRGGVKVGQVPVSPSVFSRSCQPVNVDPEGKYVSVKNVERVFSKGTAVDEFFSHDSVDDAMSALVGKPIKVENAEKEFSYDERWMTNGKAQSRPYYELNLDPTFVIPGTPAATAAPAATA